MPEKVKVNGNIEEEKDVKQIAEAIGRLLNHEVSIKKGEGGYEDRYLLYPAGEKDDIAFIIPKRDEKTGEYYYYTQLFFDVISYLKREKDPARQFLTLYSLKSAIVAILESHLKGFEITHSEVGAISFVFYIKKQSSA
ncbi:MAG: hypothetical protein RXP92_00535 [Candidatus Micrarchaeota archaeon]